MHLRKIIYGIGLLFLFLTKTFAFSIDDYNKYSIDQKRDIFLGKLHPKLDKPSQFIELNIYGINDSDKATQLEALLITCQFVIQMQKLINQGKSIPIIDLSTYQDLQKTLINHLGDSNPLIRSLAAETLIYSDKPSEKIENILINHLSLESKNEVKSGIIMAMAFAGYKSHKFCDILLQNLQGEKSVKYASLKAIAIVKPAGGLQSLLPLLKSGNGSNFCIDAIGSYGIDAKPYLAQLQKLLLNPQIKDTDGRIYVLDVTNLEHAIDNIEHPNSLKKNAADFPQTHSLVTTP